MNIFSVLQVIFIVLKVLELIDWTWWEVFIPTFASIGISFFLIFIWLLLQPGSKSRSRW